MVGGEVDESRLEGIARSVEHRHKEDPERNPLGSLGKAVGSATLSVLLVTGALYGDDVVETVSEVAETVAEYLTTAHEQGEEYIREVAYER